MPRPCLEGEGVMSLVARLQPLVETVAEMEAAADGRYEEGKKLVQEGYFHAGIYLLGYAAEIWLKTALCRVDAALMPTDTVDAHVGPARYRWQRLFGGRPPSGHDLLFLALALEDERRLAAKPQLDAVSPVLSRIFNAIIGLLYDHWFVEMRYRRQDASAEEAQKVVDSVEWLKNNYLFLWS